ncbi:hypothetical protein D3C78_1578000 [compost metagenome]
MILQIEANSTPAHSGLASRASSIICSMVGASIRSDTPSRMMVCRAASPVKAGRITCTPPDTSRLYMAEKSARWNIGMACRNAVPHLKKPLLWDASEAKARLFWLIITPLGKPVVPPV